MPTGSPIRMRLTKTQREKLATLGQRYIKSADPTVTDDSAAGYGVWDKWLNQTTGEAYVCLDATAGAADWQNISLDADDLSALFDAKVDVTGETGTVDLTAAQILVPTADSSQGAVPLQQLFDTLDQFSTSTIYGDETAHPVIAGAGSLVSTPPVATQTSVDALVEGDNLIGTFYYDTATKYIREGKYFGRFWASKNAATTVTAKIVLGYYNTGDSTWYDLDTSADEPILGTGTERSYRLGITVSNHVASDDDLYLGVKYYLTRTGNPAVTATTYLGDPYDTHLETPGIGLPESGVVHEALAVGFTVEGGTTKKTLTVDETLSTANAKAAYDDLVWRQAEAASAGTQSGDITFDPTTTQAKTGTINGNVTNLDCDLTATYSSQIVELTTTGAFALDLTPGERAGTTDVTVVGAVDAPAVITYEYDVAGLLTGDKLNITLPTSATSHGAADAYEYTLVADYVEATLLTALNDNANWTGTLSGTFSVVATELVFTYTADAEQSDLAEAEIGYTLAEWTTWITDGAAAIELPDTGTCTLLLYTLNGGTTKKALLTSTDEG